MSTRLRVLAPSRSSTLLVLVMVAGILATPGVAEAAVTPPKVAAGGTHSCVLTGTGAVKCWGANDNGQLGDGGNATQWVPVDVSGLSSGVTAIAAGEMHTCALTTGGAVKCWGANGWGQLGDGTFEDRNTPVAVSGLSSGVTSISAGYWNTCAVTTGGGVKCWGSKGFGQLGIPSPEDGTIPVPIPGLSSGVASVSVGLAHICVLTMGGGVKCWGSNTHGALGDGTFNLSGTPVDASGLSSGVAAVSAGYWHTCALTTGGSVLCWGDNELGQMLGEPGEDWGEPTPIGLGESTSISAGLSHTCALRTGGGVTCWGRNDWGQLGDGTTAEIGGADVIGFSGDAAGVAAGGQRTCATTSDSYVKCWGKWPLGDASFDVSSGTPVYVRGFGPPDPRVPETTINSGPSAQVLETDAMLEFSANEISTFECSLDADAWSPCVSPVALTGLALGQHTFQARATDLDAHVDATPATWTWDVVTSLPTTLTIYARKKVKIGREVMVMGGLEGGISACLANQEISLWKGATLWRTVATGDGATNPEGWYQFWVKIRKTIKVHVEFAGTDECLPSKSETVTIRAV